MKKADCLNILKKYLVVTLLLAANAAFAQTQPPKIVFPETQFDLGKVEEGVEMRHIFKIRNDGGKLLVIKAAFSTCGCTIPKLKKKEIQPGETVDLEVIMDTSMKQGKVDKQVEIRTNDPVNPVSTIHIKADVRSPHADLGVDKTAKIFTGRCAACHVQKGIGKTGEDLFFADCAMCHGFRAGGVPGVAPPLVPADYHNKAFADYRKKIISFGSKSHRSMPGYLKQAGGPLTEKEIDSLIDYLRWKSDFETGKNK
ncbi:MAG: DUF1573 domain-containing protein [Candidatus Obscuribacterales bacterium]|nr:DUF1573 domain-containing protein [Candidatus Obscuribacterales bacterium]